MEEKIQAAKCFEALQTQLAFRDSAEAWLWSRLWDVSTAWEHLVSLAAVTEVEMRTAFASYSKAVELLQAALSSKEQAEQEMKSELRVLMRKLEMAEMEQDRAWQEVLQSRHDVTMLQQENEQLLSSCKVAETTPAKLESPVEAMASAAESRGEVTHKHRVLEVMERRARWNHTALASRSWHGATRTYQQLQMIESRLQRIAEKKAMTPPRASDGIEITFLKLSS